MTYDANISHRRVRYTQGVLADPERVAGSRQFPYRFWSAYRNVPSLRWASTLETALELSVRNIPALPGRTLVSFAEYSERIRFRKRQSVLRTIEKVESRIGKVGHATFLGAAVDHWFDGCDRVVVFSDMQTHNQLPPLDGVSVFVFNTGGYQATPFAVGDKGHYEIGGFTDATFRLMKHLENLRDA